MLAANPIELNQNDKIMVALRGTLNHYTKSSSHLNTKEEGSRPSLKECQTNQSISLNSDSAKPYGVNMEAVLTRTIVLDEEF